LHLSETRLGLGWVRVFPILPSIQLQLVESGAGKGLQEKNAATKTWINCSEVERSSSGNAGCCYFQGWREVWLIGWRACLLAGAGLRSEAAWQGFSEPDSGKSGQYKLCNLAL